MRVNDLRNVRDRACGVLMAALLAYPAQAQNSLPATLDWTGATESLQIPGRHREALFERGVAPASTEIHYDASTRQVTIHLAVDDSQGNFIPRIRRDNFVVYENGVRQDDASVEVEHPPVSIGVLLESGGRYSSLNEAMQESVQNAAEQLLNEVGSDDRLAVWRYGDTLEPVVDFSASREEARRALRALPIPSVSELNYYDAIIAALRSLEHETGRKALIVVTSGIDTFSRASFDDVLRAARDARVPIYAISLAPVAHSQASLASISPPYAKLNWKRADQQLLELTRAARGRTYAPTSMLDLSAVYDDMIVNLRVRYVLTYTSRTDPQSTAARSVRVGLVDAKTRAPLKIIDETGRPISVAVNADSRYTPRPGALARSSDPRETSVPQATVAEP